MEASCEPIESNRIVEGSLIHVAQDYIQSEERFFMISGMNGVQGTTYLRRIAVVSGTWENGVPVSDTGPPSSSQRWMFSVACLLLSGLEAGLFHANTLPCFRGMEK